MSHWFLSKKINENKELISFPDNIDHVSERRGSMWQPGIIIGFSIITVLAGFGEAYSTVQCSILYDTVDKKAEGPYCYGVERTQELYSTVQ